MSMDTLYQDIILHHYKNPCGKGQLTDPDGSSYQVNPTCGDEINLDVLILDGKIRVGYVASGCAISQASASIMHETVNEREIEVSDDVAFAFQELMAGADESEDTLGDLIVFRGVAQYPGRVKCALLPWVALRDAKIRAGVKHAIGKVSVSDDVRAVFPS